MIDVLLNEGGGPIPVRPESPLHIEAQVWSIVTMTSMPTAIATPS